MRRLTQFDRHSKCTVLVGLPTTNEISLSNNFYFSGCQKANVSNIVAHDSSFLSVFERQKQTTRPTNTKPPRPKNKIHREGHYKFFKQNSYSYSKKKNLLFYTIYNLTF